jgi:hypothetical protein
MNSCFVSFMCLVSYCFSFSFYYCILYMYLFICFWRVNEDECLKTLCKNRRRFVFVSRTFSVFNGSFLLFWSLPWKNAAGPA